MRSTALASVPLLLASPALAEPTAQLAGGRTQVQLSQTFVDALASLGVEVAPIGTARLRQGSASFPIPSGALDVETARGDVFHAGGLALRAGATEVRLLNFVIDTTEDAVLTGLVSVNGDLVDRIPLFDLALSEAPIIERSRFVVVRGVDVTLSADAAEALNGVFGVSAFSAGLPIGEAVLATRVVKDKDRSSDDDEEKDENDS
jgi:hypothetical protein